MARTAEVGYLRSSVHQRQRGPTSFAPVSDKATEIHAGRLFATSKAALEVTSWKRDGNGTVLLMGRLAAKYPGVFAVQVCIGHAVVAGRFLLENGFCSCA